MYNSLFEMQKILFAVLDTFNTRSCYTDNALDQKMYSASTLWNKTRKYLFSLLVNDLVLRAFELLVQPV